MGNLETEITDYHKLEADIALACTELSKMEKDIIAKYCPYKIGDKVIYTEWWRGNNKDYYGKIDNIKFKGIDSDAIDNRWVIIVKPTTKKFETIKDSYNQSYKILGEKSGDVIRKA